jgi:hypothetical protein
VSTKASCSLALPPSERELTISAPKPLKRTVWSVRWNSSSSIPTHTSGCSVAWSSCACSVCLSRSAPTSIRVGGRKSSSASLI